MSGTQPKSVTEWDRDRTGVVARNPFVLVLWFVALLGLIVTVGAGVRGSRARDRMGSGVPR